MQSGNPILKMVQADFTLMDAAWCGAMESSWHKAQGHQIIMFIVLIVARDHELFVKMFHSII